MRKTFTFHSKRSNRKYEIAELNSLESADAFGLCGSPTRSIHYRMLFSIRKIDGVVQDRISNDVQARRRLEDIPESDIDMLKYHYDKEFGIDDKDLGNELTLDEEQANS